MKKTLAAAFLFAVGLAACGGGGGDGGAPAPSAKALTISMYGNPIVSSQTSAVAHAKFSLISSAVADEAPGSADAQATVQSLQSALAARGVTADVTPQVMNGTTLHQLVTSDYNGKPPSPELLTVDPSGWLIVNFQLDDMVTLATDPAQQAALKQFSDDLIVFSQWAAVAGKAVFVVEPIQTCDSPYSASAGLRAAMSTAASTGAPIRFIGQVPLHFAFDTDGKAVPLSGGDLSHLGADCRTPDDYLKNALLDSVADQIAAAYKQTGSADAASGASATE
jgi:hypothetical protein